jgi:hypothetical protein
VRDVQESDNSFPATTPAQPMTPSPIDAQPRRTRALGYIDTGITAKAWAGARPEPVESSNSVLTRTNLVPP